MQTTIIIDDELLHQARAFTGLTKKSALVREGLKALIQREAPDDSPAWAEASQV
jgi:Arc/MetJ family transcription regulator